MNSGVGLLQPQGSQMVLGQCEDCRQV